MSKHEQMPFSADSDQKRRTSLAQAVARQEEREAAIAERSDQLVTNVPMFAEQALEDAREHYERGLSPSGCVTISEGMGSIDAKTFDRLKLAAASYRHPRFPGWQFSVTYIDAEGYSGIRGAYQLYACYPTG